MSRCRRLCVGLVSVSCLLMLLAMISISNSAVAQTDSNPKWDLFVGYQWLHPGGTVPTPFGDPLNPVPFKIPDMSKGFGSALTYNFDPHWGAEFDFGHNWGDSNYETTGSVGPRFIWRTDTVNYFVHGLVSYNRLSVGGLNPDNGIGAILGGGMDLPIRKWISLRLFEADYVWAHHHYAHEAAADFPDLRRPSLEGVRLRTGLVFNWGGAPEVAPAVTCSVKPTEVMVGEPITVSASPSNFNPKHAVTYSWSGNGGQVTGKDTTAQIDTTNAAPGSYTVTVHVTDPKAKKNNEASCSASPSTLDVGGTATITCNATSPDGVPVTVSNWTATSGTVNGSGNTATLNTAGTSPGSVTVTATAADTRGLSAQGSTQLTLQNPPPPPVSPEIIALEERLALHSIYFPTGQPSAKNLKGGLVPSQQKTLLALATDFKKYLESKPDAHLILEGHADMRGSDAYNQTLSERRVAAVKSFLVEKGVPEASIETMAYGKQRNLTLDEVRQSIENNPELTSEERQRALKRIAVLKLASNRRVDVTLKTAGKTETSIRRFPFNAADALTLIGGREGEAKKKPTKKGTKKGTKKQ